MVKEIDVGWTSYDRYTFAPAVEANGFVYISGLTATNANGEIKGGSISDQARVIYRKIGRLLAAANLGPEHVVKTTDYIVSSENYRKTADVRVEFFGTHRCAATGVIVAALLHPDALIEIDVVAARPTAAQQLLNPNTTRK